MTSRLLDITAHACTTDPSAVSHARTSGVIRLKDLDRHDANASALPVAPGEVCSSIRTLFRRISSLLFANHFTLVCESLHSKARVLRPTTSCSTGAVNSSGRYRTRKWRGPVEKAASAEAHFPATREEPPPNARMTRHTPRSGNRCRAGCRPSWSCARRRERRNTLGQSHAASGRLRSQQMDAAASARAQESAICAELHPANRRLNRSTETMRKNVRHLKKLS
jgi:hypothetical protein